MMRKLFIATSLLLLSFNAFSQKEVIDKVVSIVGSEFVLLSEIEEQYAATAAERGGVPDGFKCTILNNLLAQKLLLNQAILDSIEVSDAEVESQLTARLDRILNLMNGDVEQFETYYGQSPAEVRAQMKPDLKNQILTDRMRGQILNGVTVTPSEVKAFFERIPTDSLPYFNSEVEIGEIVLYPEVNAEQKKIARDQLMDIKKQIEENGADFAEMAKKYSQDGSSRIGGDLGMQKRGSFVTEFEAAAYNLEKGGISEIIESQFGFHLIQLLERRGNAIHTRHILIKPEITPNDLELAKHKLDSIRNLLLNDSLNFSIAVKRFSNKDEQSYNNDGRLTNPKSGNTIFETGDLEPDIYFAIDTLKVGGVSQPIEFRGPRGETGYRIVVLQSRTEPHVANLNQDYSKIQNATIEEKKAMFINKWIEDKIDGTYITIDNVYACPNLEKWGYKKLIKP